MRIEVCGGADLGAVERIYVERAVALALGRFRAKLSVVCVTIEPGAPPVGAVRQQRVSLRLDGACRLLVLESDASVEAGLVRALDRTRRYLDRQSAREAWRRRAPAAAPSARRPRAAHAGGRPRPAAATREDKAR